MFAIVYLAIYFAIYFFYSRCIALGLNAIVCLFWAWSALVAGDTFNVLFLFAIAVVSAYFSYAEYKKQNQPKS